MKNELEQIRNLTGNALKSNNFSDIYDLFEDVALKVIGKIKMGDAEYNNEAFAVFNELSDRNQESINDLLCSSWFINLWDELNETSFLHMLNDRAKSLYRQTVFLRLNPQTRSEIIRREKEDDWD
ncbi:MAG: hypothetical protein DI539_02175 [Flavobacterium psychrophilum]|nr:MAG: hypothetical protein DI539_02175 [Flavobacterium psychrophilum]